jgi:hypothetical protein
VFGIGDEGGTTTLHGDAPASGFLAAWTVDGEFLWALLQGGYLDDRLRGIASFNDELDDRDFVITGGHFQGVATYGTSGADKQTFQSLNADDLVILRFDREVE